jgi:hypothetical protein
MRATARPEASRHGCRRSDCPAARDGSPQDAGGVAQPPAARRAAQNKLDQRPTVPLAAGRMPAPSGTSDLPRVSRRTRRRRAIHPAVHEGPRPAIRGGEPLTLTLSPLARGERLSSASASSPAQPDRSQLMVRHPGQPPGGVCTGAPPRPRPSPCAPPAPPPHPPPSLKDPPPSPILANSDHARALGTSGGTTP